MAIPMDQGRKKLSLKEAFPAQAQVLRTATQHIPLPAMTPSAGIPTVSAILVATAREHARLVAKSMQCFFEQTYQARQLVIVNTTGTPFLAQPQANILE